MSKIGIIGPNNSICSEALYQFGLELGQNISNKNNIIICGGMGGFMEAVCKGAKESDETFYGQTVGILPSEQANSANPYIDLSIPTGMGVARNIIIIRSVDIIIAAGGGAGTLSELAFAWQLKKKVLCVTKFEGWAQQLAGINLDTRQKDLLIPVKSIKEINHYLEKINML